jgi:hypothetical protein
MLKKQFVWVTQDKREIPIKDMETTHIQNCVAMLRRKGWISADEAAPFPVPPCAANMGEFAYEAACESFEWEATEYLRQRHRVHPAIKLMETELMNRGVMP